MLFSSKSYRMVYFSTSFINFILSSDLKKSKGLLSTLNVAIFNSMYYLLCAEQTADIFLMSVHILNTTYKWSVDGEISAIAYSVEKRRILSGNSFSIPFVRTALAELKRNNLSCVPPLFFPIWSLTKRTQFFLM